MENALETEGIVLTASLGVLFGGILLGDGLRTSFWVKILISSLILASSAYSQDKQALIDQLSSPFQQERGDAAAELAGILTEKEYVKLYTDDIDAFWELSAAGIPDGETLETILLSSKSPKLAADTLLRAGRIGLMENRKYEYHRVVDEMREAWWDGWRDRIALDPANGEQIRYILARPWLKQIFRDRTKWLSNRLTNRYSLICNIIDAMDVDVKLPVETQDWLKVMRACLVSGKNEMMAREFCCGVGHFGGLGEREWSEAFWYITHAEIICIVLDKPEWIIEIAPKLKKTAHFEFQGFNAEAKRKDVDCHNPLIYITALSACYKIDTLIEEVEKYVAAKVRWPLFSDDWVLSNYWMDAAVGDKKFLDWYVENIKPTQLKPIDRLKLLK